MKLDFADISITLTRKKIKNLNLTVVPPYGEVRISAPYGVDASFIKKFVLSRLDWIVEQQKSILEHARKTSCKYITGEHHQLWGEEVTLLIIERRGPTGGRLAHGTLLLQVQPGADYRARKDAMFKWYKGRLERAMPDLISYWENVMAVRVKKFSVRQMKTQWGSCTPARGTVRFNVELARRRPCLIEYIVVHELVHLLEPSHNDRFKAFMNDYMPLWKSYRDELNLLPLPYEFWE